MFGLEKKKKENQFIFDLEKELHTDKKRGKELLQKIEKILQEMELHKKNQKEKDADHDFLLLAYHALQKVLKKALKKA